jgi:L-amino acid N-acyltransferase YncA
VTANDLETAEVALVVAHDQHLHGVGTALLRRIAHIARHNGLRRFVADILAENSLMFKVLCDAGWRHQHHRDGLVTHVEIELSELK